MKEARVSLRPVIDSGLQQWLDSANELAQRRAAVAVAEFATERTGLVDDRIVLAIEYLRRGESGESPQRSDVQTLTEELDESAWAVQAEVEQGKRDERDYGLAFSKARAAASVWAAMDADAKYAATEALYEGGHAVNDSDAVRRVVERALNLTVAPE